MITRYGMSPRLRHGGAGDSYQSVSGRRHLPCLLRRKPRRKLTVRWLRWSRSSTPKAIEILSENREKLDELAQYLYEKETITGDEFMKILNAE